MRINDLGLDSFVEEYVPETKTKSQCATVLAVFPEFEDVLSVERDKNLTVKRLKQNFANDAKATKRIIIEILDSSMTRLLCYTWRDLTPFRI